MKGAYQQIAELEADVAREHTRAERLAGALREALGALGWCGGSFDFTPNGQAREGWEGIVVPARDRAEEALAEWDKP